MRESVVKRGKDTWSLVFDVGYGVNKKGRYARLQRWVTFVGTTQEA